MSAAVSAHAVGLPFFVSSYAAPAPFEIASAGNLPAASIVVSNLGEPACSLSSSAIDTILLDDDRFLFAVVDLFVCDPVAYGAWCGSGFEGAWPVPAGVNPESGFGSDRFPGTQAFVLCGAGVPGGIVVVGADELDGAVAGFYCLPDLPALPAFVPFSVPGCAFARKEPSLANLPVAGQPGASRSLCSFAVLGEVVLAWPEFQRWSAGLLLEDEPWLASRAGLARAAGGYTGESGLLVRPVSVWGSAVGGVLIDQSGYSYARYACRLLSSVAAVAIEESAARAAAAAAPVPSPAASGLPFIEEALLAAAAAVNPAVAAVASGSAPFALEVEDALPPVAAAAYLSAVAAARVFLAAVAAAAER